MPQESPEVVFDQALQRVVAKMAAAGYPVTIVSRNRTAAQQARLAAKGPATTTLDGTRKISHHQTGTGADVAFLVNGKPSFDKTLPWDHLGRVAQEEGLTWGGTWTQPKDLGHVQLGKGLPMAPQAQTTPPPAGPPAPPPGAPGVVDDEIILSPTAVAPVQPPQPRGWLDVAQDVGSMLLRDPVSGETGVSGLIQRGIRTASGMAAPYLGSREAIRSTAGVVLPAAGSIAGATLMGRTGSPDRALAGSAVGAGVGETLAMGVEALTGAPPTFQDVITRPQTAALTGGVAEKGAQLGLGVAKKVLAPVASKLTAAGQEALLKYGPRFTPAQVTDSRGLNIAENVAKGAMFGGSRYHTFLEGQERFFEGERRRLIEGFGGSVTPEKAGKFWQAAREAGLDRFEQQARQKYADVAEKAGDAAVPMDALIDFAKTELTKREAIPGEVTGDTGLRLLRQVVAAEKKDEGAEALIGGMTLQDLQASPGTAHLVAALKAQGVIPEAGGLSKSLSYQQADFFASELKRLIRESEGIPGAQKDRAVGVAKQLLKRLEGAIDQSLPPEAAVARANAQTFYKAGKQQFDSKLLRTLARKNPEFVVDALERPGAVTVVRAAREAVTDQDWRKIQSLTVQRLLSDPEGKLVTGGELLKRMHGPEGKMRQTLRELFPSGEDAEVWQLARILDQVQQGKEGTGRMWVQLTQAGAMANMAAGGKTGRVARATLVVPWLLSKLMTSPQGRKWLTTGFTAPPGSEAFVRSVSQATAFLAREAGGAAGEAFGTGTEASGPPPENPFSGASGPPPENPWKR